MHVCTLVFYIWTVYGIHSSQSLWSSSTQCWKFSTNTLLLLSSPPFDPSWKAEHWIFLIYNNLRVPLKRLLTKFDHCSVRICICVHKSWTKQVFLNLSAIVKILTLSSILWSWRASQNFKHSLWILWIHSDTVSDFHFFDNVPFSMYILFKNSFNSSQHFRFLWVIAIHGSPLILVRTDLFNVSSPLGCLTWMPYLHSQQMLVHLFCHL